MSIRGQVIFLDGPIFEIRFRKSSNHDEDHHTDVQAREDVVKSEKIKKQMVTCDYWLVGSSNQRIENSLVGIWIAN